MRRYMHSAQKHPFALIEHVQANVCAPTGSFEKRLLLVQGAG